MTNVDVFQVLATQDAEEQDRLSSKRAVIASQTRAKTQFSAYLAKASNETELAARLEMLDDRIRAIATEAAGDYGYEDVEKIYLATTVALGGGHASGCECGFCANMGKGFGQSDESPVDSDKGDEDAEREDEDEFEKAARVACACGCGGKCAGKCECGDGECSCSTKESKVRTAEFETGYQSETVNLPGADASGLGSEASPSIDKGTAGGLEAIDVGSVRNKLEVQDLTENGSFDYSDAAVDPSSPLRKSIDADKPLQPEFNVAPNTKTFGDQKNQADPVTSSTKLDNWLVVT